MKPGLPIAAILLAAHSLSSADPAPDGETLFTQNCMACHMKDQGLVGPSLVEIRSLYLDKPGDFVKWAVAPGKKRPGAIDMPSMVHVGEPGLKAIHAYIMTAAKGVKEQKKQEGDPFTASPTQAARPLIQRIFLPNAGPAAIGVALDDNTSLCWDAGTCSLRYAWTGGFIDGYPYWKGNGSSIAKIKGTVRYTEAKPLFSSEAKFGGYEIRERLPVFLYTLAGMKITETFAALPEGRGFRRTVTTIPVSKDAVVLRLSFPDDPKVKITCDVGVWNGHTLTLNAERAANFTLTYLFQ